MKSMAYALLLTSLAVLPASAQDQDSLATGGWRLVLGAGLGVTQSAYSDNWTGGEVGSLVWVANLQAVAEKQLYPWLRTENNLKLSFGQTHTQVDTSDRWLKPAKSSDKIRFDTVEKFTVDLFVDPYVAGVFESQFYDASFPAKKRYVNPIELTESAGLARTLVDVGEYKISTRTGFGFRQRIDRVIDDPVALTTRTETVNDGGLEWVTDGFLQLNRDLTYTTKVSLFKALFSSNEDSLAAAGKAGYWETVDVNWDNVLTAQVTKIVQVSLAWQLLYDKEIDVGGRFKEALALGVAWQF
ncbi:MAG: DUF3078 domain-containing protein [Candidatus Zixiibacteriota bacterium]|nr:MAG: DUF3078 domain-containing protein [candidate division Zixibacteria bacterium]